MRRPRVSPSTQNGRSSIQRLGINSAARAAALAEFERAEAATDALMFVVEQYRQCLSALRRAFAVHRQRHG